MVIFFYYFVPCLGRLNSPRAFSIPIHFTITLVMGDSVNLTQSENAVSDSFQETPEGAAVSMEEKSDDATSSNVYVAGNIKLSSSQIQ